MKKLLLSVGLCILITLSLAGCNLFGPSNDNPTPQKSSTDTPQKSSNTDTTQKNSNVDKNTTSQNEDKQSKNSSSQSKDSSSDDQTTIKQDTPKSQKQTVGKVTFCENVDSNLNPINASTRFTTGRIYARLQSSTPFNTTRIKITLIYVDGSSEYVLDKTTEDCDPEWSIYAFPVTTVDSGKYKVIITDDITNKKIGEGTFTAEAF